MPGECVGDFMKLAHLSDLHFYVPPTLRGTFGKRLLGLANLYIKGRIHHFPTAVALEAIECIAGLKPDAVLLTGDLTALASPAEFTFAREALSPLIDHFPTYIVPGNHDYYTSRADATHRIETYFGEWIRTPEALGGTGQPTWPSLHLQQDVAILGVNPSRFHLGSSGLLKPEELARLEAMLQREDVQSRFRILMIHYPLLNRQGIATAKYWRRLENRQLLLDVLKRHPVHLVVHGHDHLRYLNHLRVPGQPPTYLYNSGSGAFNRGPTYPIRASFNQYTVEDQTLTWVEHFDRGIAGFEKTWEGPPMQERWAMADLGGY